MTIAALAVSTAALVPGPALAAPSPPAAPVTVAAAPPVIVPVDVSPAEALLAASITGKIVDQNLVAEAGVPVTAHRVVGVGSEATLIPSPTVLSGATGSYSIPGLVAGTYSLEFGGHGSDYPSLWLIEPITDRVEPEPFFAWRFPLASSQNFVQNVQVAPFGSVKVDVRDLASDPVPGATLTLMREGVSGAYEVGTDVTSADGSHTFEQVAAGSYQIVALHGERDVRVDKVVVGGSLETVEVGVTWHAKVSGVVTDSTGAPIAGAVVHAVRPSGGIALKTTTDAGGAYVFEGLFDGPLTIRASTTGRVPLYLGGATSPLDAEYRTAGSQPIIDADIQFPASPRVGGQLVDSDGAPVADAPVWLISKSDATDVGTVSGADGRFGFAHVPAGEYTLLFEAPGGSALASAWYGGPTEQGAEYFTIAASDLDVGTTLLTAGATISGTVTPTHPGDELTVTLYRWAAGGVVAALIVAEPEGTQFEFTNLDPGSYTVGVMAGDSHRWLGGAATASTAASIAIAAGEVRSDAHIAFPQFAGKISGRVTPVAGVATDWSEAWVYAETLDGSKGLGVKPSSDGRFTIAGLEPGTYRVAIFGLKGHVETWYRSGTATVSAAAATPVTVGSSAVTVNFTAIAANGTLRGRLEGTDFLPGRDASVTLMVVDVDGIARYVDDTTTDMNGEFAFTNKVRQGEYYILYTGFEGWDEWYTSGWSVRDIGDSELIVSNAASVHVNFTLGERLAVGGVVRDQATDAVLRDILVTAIDTENGDVYEARTDEAGEYAVTHLRRGTYKIRFGDFTSAEALHGYYGPEWYGGSLGSGGAVTVAVDGNVDLGVAHVEQGALISGSVAATVAPHPTIWLRGATVNLYVSGELLTSTVVRSGYGEGDAPGAFRFRVKAGSYKVCVLPPAERTDIVPGCWNGVVGQAAPGKSATVGKAIAVVPGQERTGIDIGLVAWQTLTSATPTISGKAAVGVTLQAVTGTWTSGTAFTYKWLANGAAVSGATSPTFALTPAMLGKRISVTVTGTKPGFRTIVKTSAQTAAVALGTLAAPTPAVSGSLAVGYRLTAVTGAWTTGTALKYQWYAGGVAISGATASKFTLTTAQKDKQMAVRVTGTLTGYTSTSKTSPLTAKVTTVGTPTITGIARTGSTLTASPGVWAPSTAFAYQWYAAGVAIAGATSTTFTPSATQDGKAITVRVTGSKAGYGTVARTSAPTLKVMRYSTPTITGSLAVGITLTAKANTWSTGTVFTYQWYAAGVAITGATKSTFVLTTAQRDKQMSVRITGAQAGYTTVAATSALSAKVTTVATPTIAGTLRAGATLTANPGTWGTGTIFTYQWAADGVAITGATQKTVLLTAAQVGAQITVTVTGTRTGYATVSRISAKTLKVALTSLPTISGTAIVGGVLAAQPGTWTAGTAFAYQWYAGGVAISGATGASLALTAAHGGAQITVTVTGSLTGYPTVARTSAAVPVT